MLNFLFYVSIFGLALCAAEVARPGTCEVVIMEPGNRMVRLGFGQNSYDWFLRIDLWFFGIRIK